MEVSETQNVVFHGIADEYNVRVNESIACHYAVSPSVARSARDLVGIFKINWKQTQECLTFDWSPSSFGSATEQAMNDCCVLLNGGKLLSAISSQCSSEETYYQFCYVDASDTVQGRSKPFRLAFESKPDSNMASLNAFTFLGGDEEFVEVGADEDGEIVIIKPKISFLEEELSRVNNNAKNKDLEIHQLRNENDILSLQLSKIREVYVKVLLEKETLQKMLGDLHQNHEVEISRVLLDNAEVKQQLLLKRDECSRLESEISVMKLDVKNQSGSSGADVIRSERTINNNMIRHHTGPFNSSDLSEPVGACPSGANDESLSVVQQVPRSLGLLPDVASVCTRKSPCVIAGSPPRIYSPTTARSPGSRPWFGESIIGGLNLIQFVVQMIRCSGGASGSRFESVQYILRSPNNNDEVSPWEGSGRHVLCPFCQVHIHPSSGVSMQQRLADHILSVHCWRDV